MTLVTRSNGTGAYLIYPSRAFSNTNLHPHTNEEQIRDTANVSNRSKLHCLLIYSQIRYACIPWITLPPDSQTRLPWFAFAASFYAMVTHQERWRKVVVTIFVFLSLSFNNCFTSYLVCLPGILINRSSRLIKLILLLYHDAEPSLILLATFNYKRTRHYHAIRPSIRPPE